MSAAPPDDRPGDAPAPARRWGPAALLLLGPTFFAIALGVGTALAPVLLVRAPLLLIALNPAPRHLVLVAGVVDPWLLSLVAIVRMFAPDPFWYVLGRRYGPGAIAWVERRAGRFAGLVRWVERTFARARHAVLFAAPAGIVCVLAGASGMRVGTFVLVDIAGTATGVTVVRLAGRALANVMDAVRAFVASNVGWLTAASIALALVAALARPRRPPPPGTT